MLNKRDIVLFGATGFTGKRIISELNRLIKLENISLTWGIAGRSKQKLRDALEEVEKKTGDDLSDIGIISADATNEASLIEMTSKARAVINATGPFRFFGEAVVKACLVTSTHYVDITGEPEFMEKIQLNYHEEALWKNVYLVCSCGMDCIPTDMGAIFLMKNFNGTLNSIETYTYIQSEGDHPGPVLNYTTWESGVHSLANSKNLSKIRSQLLSQRLPRCEPKLESKQKIFKNNVTGKWSLPFPGADRSVLVRTQRFFYEQNHQRPIQIQCYMDFEKYFNAFLAVLFGGIFAKMCRYEWTRSLLLKYPRLFSYGTFTSGGPSEEKQAHSLLNVYLDGKGWNEKLSEPTEQFKMLPNKNVLAKVTARNPGYGATCTGAVLSAITILTETEKLPNQGGCYTPGSAFVNTSLIEKLQKYGMKFEIQSKL